MRLGPYELVTLIGAGGMGEVWAAHRATGNSAEVIAVKRLPDRLADDPAYRRSLLDEARLAMLLRHPNIIHVFDAGEVDNQAYIAMEFVHGLDLSRLRKLLEHSGEQISPALSAFVIGEILEGLDFAHNLVHEGELLCLIHRDVSPHNVILSTTGEVKLTDYGVARLSSEDTSGTHVKGKARYMPPEQLRGESRSPTIDLFAAGAVLHELLDGSMFRGEAVDDARLLGMAIDGVVPPLRRPSQIPPALERLRQRLLTPDPQLRIESASEALELLRRWDGYRDASAEVGALVQRHLAQSLSLAQQPTQTGLAHQATFLQTNDAVLDLHGAEELDEFAALEGASERLLEPEGPPPPTPRTGSHAALSPSPSGPQARPAGASNDRSSAGASVDEHPASTLELSSPNASFARHVATSPNPTLPQARVARRLIVAGLAAALALGAWLGRDRLFPAPAPTPTPDEPTTGLRKARVIGADFAGYAGFRDRQMDRLTSEQDILYSYLREPSAGSSGPLAALGAGEAEFVLTTLEQVLLDHARGGEAGSAGKIVAIVDVSIGGDALVLDSVEHPKLRSLEDLASVQAALGPARRPSLVYARDSPSEYLELRLDALLASVDPPALHRARGLDHIQAVYDALLADADADAPVVAALLWEPWISQAVAAGMTVAASTRDLPYAVVDVLVASERVLDQDRALVDAVVNRYYDVVEVQRAQPELLIERVAQDVGLTEAEARGALAGLCVLDARGAARWFPAGDDAPELLALTIETTWSTLRAAGRVEGPAPALDELIDAGPLRAAVEDEPADARGLDDCLAEIETTGRANQGLGLVELPASDAPWFSPGGASLDTARAGELDELAARLQAFNPRTIRAQVTGFGETGDRRGRALGQARARALVDALTQAGVELELDARGAKAGPGAPASAIQIRLLRVADER